MSAFMVTDKHIDALVIFAARNNVSFKVNGNRVYVTKTNAEEIGQQLIDENYRSVNARYAERAEGYFGKAPIYKIAITKALQKPDLEPIVIIKQCHCYAYQACESQDWEQSAAFEIVNAIEAAAVRKLPGYDAAPWGLD